MKRFFLLLLASIAAIFTSACQSNKGANSNKTDGQKAADDKGVTYECDSFTTAKGRKVAITFIKHGTLMIDVDGFIIHIDPVTIYGTDYDKLPKADLLLVTHEHYDHYDKAAIAKVSKEGTRFMSNKQVSKLSEKSEAMAVNDTMDADNGTIIVTALAAYNTTPAHTQYHPKGRDVGFLIDIDDLRIYISGDTEDIPEMQQLKDVDVAFLSVNQPYTMTPAQCIKAIDMFSPKIVYPYHYGETDLTPIINHFKGSKTEIRIRQMQ
jgi:L-ascorbate metabolism protein UlaG (beta-lactamase superfamily)